MDDEAVADMFGTTEGFTATAVARNPETVVVDSLDEEEEDF